MNMESTDCITLVVKAPTQQIEDQTIKCNANWTVAALKTHLAETYPSKPNPNHQRLIYYGQLLMDNETLQEIITRFGANETTHTVHLVCIPPRVSTNQPQPVNITGTVNEQANRQPAAPTAEDAYRFFMNPAGYQPWMNDVNSGYFQQLAWAQQAYASYYMTHYMDMMARQIDENGAYAAPGVDRNAARQPDAAPQRMDEDERNRDWLDFLYIGARVLVLVSIVYFYSSPARFVIVSFLALAVYLYQVGFFRIHLQFVENNNEAINNNMPAENNNIVQGAAAQENDENDDRPQSAPVVPPPPAPPIRPSLAALTWTFFSSFFASLIPENPQVV